MKFEEIDWADSSIEKICIEYDRAVLFVYNDALERNMCVTCRGFIGLTNLCIWDDQIIDCAEVNKITDDSENEFVCKLFSVYDKNMSYGERRLSDGIIELRVRLVNNITFSLYCQGIEAEELS